MLVAGTSSPGSQLLPGRTGSLVSQSHPAGAERDERAAHTVPCFFHRFGVSISMELMNNSNMNIIHCIWAGVVSDRGGIKSSKRLEGSAPARAGEGWWEGDERLRAHTIPARASDTQPHSRDSLSRRQWGRLGLSGPGSAHGDGEVLAAPGSSAFIVSVSPLSSPSLSK